MANLQISDNGLAIIKKYESCYLKAYKDPAGVWTIGYGHTSGVKAGQTITRTQAEQFLESDCAVAEKAVNSYGSKYFWNQNEFDALVSFTFNVGSGNLKKLLNDGKRTKSEISTKMLEYNKGGGIVLPGLVKRRAEEKALFNSSSVSILKISPTVKCIQSWLNKYYGGTLFVDGIYGPKTKKALVMALQTELGVTVDGIYGTKTSAAVESKATIKSGSTGIYVTLWQVVLVCDKYTLGDIDGVFGDKTKSATIAFQKAKGLSADGIAGIKTWRKALA